MSLNIISVENIKTWIKSQPDDRLVNMRESQSNSDCGCAMVQYAKENYPDMYFKRCSWRGWLSGEHNSQTSVMMFEEGALFEIFKKLSVRLYGHGDIIDELFICETFGDLKNLLA